MANRNSRRAAKVQYQRTFEKRFGWIRQIDLTDEYLKVRLGISTLSELKQTRLLEYVRFRYLGEPEFKAAIDKLESVLAEKAKSIKDGNQADM